MQDENKQKVDILAKEVYDMFWEATMAVAFSKIQFEFLPSFHKDAWSMIVKHLYNKFSSPVNNLGKGTEGINNVNKIEPIILTPELFNKDAVVAGINPLQRTFLLKYFALNIKTE